MGCIVIIKLKKVSGDVVETKINKDCTKKEVLEFYSDNNFLGFCCDEQVDQVKEINFLGRFENDFAGMRESTVIAYKNEIGSYSFI